MRKELMVILLVLSCAVFGSAQEVYRKVTPRNQETVVHFRFDRPQFDLTYLDNEKKIQEIDQLIDSIGYEKVDSVVIISQSSPEGVYEHNIKLSRGRATSIAYFMRNRYPQIAKQIYSTHAGEAWGRLRDYIVGDQVLTEEQKEKAVGIIDSDINVGTKKWRMQQLPFYRYLQQKYYKYIRYSAICMVYYSQQEIVPELPELEIPVIEEPDIELPVSQVVPLKVSLTLPPLLEYRRGKIREAQPPSNQPTGTEEVKEPAATVLRTPIVAFRTNLLLPGLNVGVDVPIAEHWSVGANYYYPWFWPKKENKDCYELLGWELEGRYWFGRHRQGHQRLLGHSVGLNVYGGYYDLEKDFRGMQGEFISTGIGYRFGLPLGRKRWGHLEFAITIGYLHSTGRTYDVNRPGGPLFGDDNLVKFNFFGPTKAEVTLNIPIYKKKEGKR